MTPPSRAPPACGAGDCRLQGYGPGSLFRRSAAGSVHRGRKLEAELLEAVTLAEEILERGPGDGRGARLAALVLRLNEGMMRGDAPLSWRPPVPASQTKSILPPIPRAGPVLDWSDYVPPPDDLPGPDDLERAWEQVEPGYVPPSQRPTPRPRITLSPPEYQAGGELEHLVDDPDVIVLDESDLEPDAG